ncbi:hypothetical protein C8Q78DRAFT_929570, partial [Trametes maxima]
SRRNDTEYLLYVLLEIYRGKFPWAGTRAPSWPAKAWLIREKTRPLATHFGPSSRAFAARSRRSLAYKYGEAPDYEHPRWLFRERMREEGWAYDGRFDWMDGAGVGRG